MVATYNFGSVYMLVLERCSVHGYFGNLSSSDNTTLSSNTYEVSNIHNCHFIEVHCLNAYLLFAAI